MKNGILLASCIMLASLSQAAVVLQDTFDQPAGSLNGLAPSKPFASGNLWTADNHWSVSGTGVASNTGGWDAQASIPITLTAGNVYTLTAQLTVLADGGDWVGFGFASGVNGGIFSGEYNPSVLVKNTGAIEYFTFPGAAGSVDGLFTPGVQHDFTITINTTAAEWTGSFGIDGATLIAPSAFSSNPTEISRLVLTGANETGATINSITVTAVPEPSTYAIIAGMLALVVAPIRRRI